jgi:hypothetical protein
MLAPIRSHPCPQKFHFLPSETLFLDRAQKAFSALFVRQLGNRWVVLTLCLSDIFMSPH